MSRIGVIGNGSWATAMIKMLSDNKQPKTINWWVRRSEDIAYIKQYHHNPSYLTGVEVKLDQIALFEQSKAVIENSDIIILNTPAAYLEAALAEISAEDLAGKIIVSAIKGIVPATKQLVGDYLSERYAFPSESLVVIGGPCHAEEVSLEKLSYLTFACQKHDYARRVAQLFENHYIKTILSEDIVGVEYGAVLKNIYALAGGICHGLGYGDNFQAVLMSNAIREMEHFLDVIDPRDRQINDSAYLGDLLVTGYSQFSRNRTFGNMLGKGYSVTSAQHEMKMVAEGYLASDCIQQAIKEHDIQMPICNTVFQILYRSASPKAAVRDLADNLT